MQIISRLAISADGYVTTPDGWPAQVADPVFDPGQSHGIPEFLVGKEAALMGRTTFEPALGAAAGHGRTSTCSSSRHGGPREPRLVVLPYMLGTGLRLTPALSLDTKLTLQRERALPGGSVEIVYSCG